jgi:poly-beta-1,6-N-acetyl-D-glucosamine biosynthesis protein PgaD
MGESGPRVSYPQIIDKPKLKSPLRHFLEGSITAGLWALWAYGALPLLTIFLWALGIKFFYQKLLGENGFNQLVEILKNGGTVIIIILTIKLVWIYYNYYMIFKRLGRRRLQSTVCPDATFAAFFHVDQKILAEAKKHSRLEVSLKDHSLTVISETPGRSVQKI